MKDLLRSQLTESEVTGEVNWHQRTQHVYSLLSQAQREETYPGHEDRIDHDTGMYEIEKVLRNKILGSCEENGYSEEQLQKTDFAIGLAIFAHRDQFRETGLPYSTHFLGMGAELAEEDKDAQDDTTVISAILHDTIEDTTLTKDDLEMLFGADIAYTIDSLTNYEGDLVRKSIVDERERIRIIKSLVDNPRVARIKIKDKLFNLRDIEVKSTAKRTKSINEREDVFIPLAELIGAQDDAEEMRRLCLAKRNKSSEDKLRHKERDKTLLQSDDIQNEVKHSIEHIVGNFGSEVKVHLKEPQYKDLYDYGDFRLGADIVINQNSLGNPRWLEKAATVLFAVFQNRRIQNPQTDLNTIIKDVETTDRKYLQIDAELSDGISLPISIRIIPKDEFALENINLRDIYLPDNASPALKQRKLLAQRKQGIISKKLEGLIDSGIKSASIIKELRPSVPPGYTTIIGEDSQGRKERWRVPEGTTVISLSQDIYPNKWHHARSAKVNGTYVGLTHTLNPGDEVHIEYSDKPEWDPEWVFGFAEGTKGRASVQRNITKIEKKESRSGQREMYSRILQLGKKVIENHMPPESRPLWVSPQKVIHLLHQIYGPQMGETEFLTEVGRGNIPDRIISDVAEALAPINMAVQEISFQFSPSSSGQIDAITTLIAAEFKINLLGVGGENLTNDFSVIKIYIDPDDEVHIPQILSRFQDHANLKELGLIAATVSSKK